MREDGPTIPNQGWNTPAPPGAPAEPDAPEALNAPYLPGAVPRWSPVSARRAALTRSGQAPKGYVSATLFGVSVGINVALLIGWIGLIALSYAGVLPSGGSRLAGGTAAGRASVTPASTLTPALSPTASAAGWLQIAPTSVQLGCGDGQDTQTVVLSNTGSRRVSWQAQFSGSSDQSGVSLSQQSGRLDAGSSVEIQLQNTTQSSNSQQGVIQFTSSSQDAGPPASLSYTAQGCH